MPTSAQQISKFKLDQRGFSLIEVLVALILVSMMFLAIPSGDNTQQHRDLQTAVDDIDRSIRFASNESILRNTVVRLSIDMDKTPVQYNVEYGPPGNIPLPDMTQEKTTLSLAEEKTEKEKLTKLDQQFTKVEEFEEILHEISDDVTIQGVASSSQKKMFTDGKAYLYFYPTGEKDGGLIFFATEQEIAYLEIQPFLSETNTSFEVFDVAKGEDFIQTRMDEVYKQWIGK